MMLASNHLSRNSFSNQLRIFYGSLTCLVGNFLVKKFEEQKEGAEIKRTIKFLLLRGNLLVTQNNKNLTEQ
jgi:hypothetical protein